MSPVNHHATALVIADRGILIAGRSGAGKSSLALALIAHCRACGLFARLVADDQVFLHEIAGRVIASAPGATSGLAEAWGAGPARLLFEPRAVLDMGVGLVEAGAAPRLSEGAREILPGIRLPWLELAEGNTPGAGLAVLARLGISPFG